MASFQQLRFKGKVHLSHDTQRMETLPCMLCSIKLFIPCSQNIYSRNKCRQSDHTPLIATCGTTADVTHGQGTPGRLEFCGGLCFIFSKLLGMMPTLVGCHFATVYF